jgi:tetratricopeptide (TPR) repeat protein
MKATTRLIAPLLLALAYSTAFATAADLDRELATLFREFDAAKYDTPDGDPRAKAFEALRLRAANLEKQYPGRAEPLVWEAWALSEQANVLRNYSALGMCKDAIAKLEAALTLDPKVYGADSYASLGQLHAIGTGMPFLFRFGDKKKARAYLQQALAIDSIGAQQNLWYADLLLKEKDYAGALKFATAASLAPARPGREKADADLHSRAEAKIAKAKEKLR